MNIPPEILETQRYRVEKAVDATLALRDGFITVRECLDIMDLAIDWCEFVNQLYIVGSRDGEEVRQAV